MILDRTLYDNRLKIWTQFDVCKTISFDLVVGCNGVVALDWLHKDMSRLLGSCHMISMNNQKTLMMQQDRDIKLLGFFSYSDSNLNAAWYLKNYMRIFFYTFYIRTITITNYSKQCVTECGTQLKPIAMSGVASKPLLYIGYLG